jgi:nicotinamidase-related amidase
MSWRTQIDQVELVVVDAQEKLLAVMPEASLLEKRLSQLISACVKLGIPVSFTEQYPEGLGKTLPALRQLAPAAPVFEKTSFSAGQFHQQWSRKKIILAGLETHICVRQTLYDLIMQRKTVMVVADACGSRFPENKALALAEFAADKMLLTSVEALLFELLGDSEHPQFKQIQALIK